MTALEVLQRGRERIARGKCEGTYAIDTGLNRTTPDDPEACMWCARGALGDVGSGGTFSTPEGVEAYKLLLKGANVDNMTALFKFSDESSQSVVIAAFDRAIVFGQLG